MIISDLNKDLLVVVHCYEGDKNQVLGLLPYYEHHQAPIVIASPADSQVHGIGPHICISAGKRAYVGQDSWDRQQAQLEKLLQYPQKWFLLNDSDSFVVTPKLPDYLFKDDNIVYSNEVNDFRRPGESWQGLPPWPLDFHKGFPLIAMQPPYFLSRNALEKIVKASKGMVACPICPFIDWWWVPACYAAMVKHRPFTSGASCETVTPSGRKAMQECIQFRGASFLHSIKSKAVADDMVGLFHKTYG